MHLFFIRFQLWFFQQTHALVDQNFYDDSDVDQNLCGDDTAELCNSNSQPEVLPKTLSRKDVYAHENDIKIAKSVGIGIDNTKLECNFFLSTSFLSISLDSSHRRSWRLHFNSVMLVDLIFLI